MNDLFPIQQYSKKIKIEKLRSSLNVFFCAIPGS